jgi:hypothetical protein
VFAALPRSSSWLVHARTAAAAVDAFSAAHGEATPVRPSNSLVVSALLSAQCEATIADVLPASHMGRAVRTRSCRMSQRPSRLGDVSAAQGTMHGTLHYGVPVIIIHHHLPSLLLPIGVGTPLRLLLGSAYEVLPVLILRSGHLLENAYAPLLGGLDHYEAVLCRHCDRRPGPVWPGGPRPFVTPRLDCAGATLTTAHSNALRFWPGSGRYPFSVLTCPVWLPTSRKSPPRWMLCCGVPPPVGMCLTV